VYDVALLVELNITIERINKLFGKQTREQKGCPMLLL